MHKTCVKLGRAMMGVLNAFKGKSRHIYHSRCEVQNADWTVPIPCMWAQGEMIPSEMWGISTSDIPVERQPIQALPSHTRKHPRRMKRL